MTNDGEVLDGVEGLPFPFPVPFPPDPFHDDRLPKWDDKDFPDIDDKWDDKFDDKWDDKFDDKDWDDVKKKHKKKKKKTRTCFPGTSTVTLADGTTKSMASRPARESSAAARRRRRRTAGPGRDAAAAVTWIFRGRATEDAG